MGMTKSGRLTVFCFSAHRIAVNTQGGSKMDSMMPTTRATPSFSQGNVEAMVKFGQVWAAGLQDLSRTMAAVTKGHIDDTVSTMKALSGAKSISEAIQMQQAFARTSLEKAVAETGTLTSVSFKLAEASMAPFMDWMNFAAEKLTRTPN
jgi:phasin family protein